MSDGLLLLAYNILLVPPPMLVGALIMWLFLKSNDYIKTNRQGWFVGIIFLLMIPFFLVGMFSYWRFLTNYLGNLT